MAKGTSEIADEPLIGLLGGTFDPIHLGHIAAAQLVRRRLGLGSVRMMLSARPSHRAVPAASIEHRFEMLKIACAQSEGLIADDQELRRLSPSYTVVTLEHLHDRFPGSTFCWIVGSDAFLGLTQWYRWQRLFELAHVIVCQRVGSEVNIRPRPVGDIRKDDAGLPLELAKVVRDRLCERLPEGDVGGLLFLSDSLPEISSSDLRMRLYGNKSVENLLPEGVSTYIKHHGLYCHRETN